MSVTPKCDWSAHDENMRMMGYCPYCHIPVLHIPNLQGAQDNSLYAKFAKISQEDVNSPTFGIAQDEIDRSIRYLDPDKG